MAVRMTKKYAFGLALFVLAGALAATAAVFLTGHNLIWSHDEFYQDVNKLYYFSRTIREAFASLIAGNGFALPSYTMSVGYGIDMFTFVGAFGNVFDWPAVLCPARFMEFYYVAIIFIRVVLAAVAFAYFCLQRGATREGAFLGAVCFALSGYVVFLGMLRHPIFLTVLVFFPLILAGADKVFAGKRSWLFVVSMAAMFLASVYYAYMVCFALLVYCLIVYFFGGRKRSVRDFVLLVLKFALLLVLAFVIAAILAYPRVMALLSQERLGISRYKADWFEFPYYADIVTDSLGVTTRTQTLYYGPVGLVLLGVFLVCGKHFDKKKRYALRIALAATLACICIPFLSRMFNGFTYETDRWMFLAGFCCSYVVCLTVPILPKLAGRDWARVFALAALVVAWCVARSFLKDLNPVRTLAMLGLFAVVLVAVPLVCRRLSTDKLAGVLSVVTVVAVAVSSSLYCLPSGADYADNFIRMGSARARIFENSYAEVMDKVDDGDVFRYAPAKVYSMRNAGLNHGTNAVDFYNSSYVQAVDTWRSEIGVSDHYYNFCYLGSDSRFAVDMLTGTRYYVTGEDDTWRIPYGYSETSLSKNGYDVWETELSLPLAFATSNVIAKSDYAELDMADKQSAMLEAAIVEDEIAADYTAVEFAPTAQRPDVKMTMGKNVKLSDDGKSLTALANDCTVTLEFEGTPESETYVHFQNLSYNFLEPSEIADLKSKDSDDKLLDDLWSDPPTTFSVNIDWGKHSKTYKMGTKRSHQYGGKHNWLLNTGYVEKPVTKIVLTFDRRGVYTFDELEVVCQPVAPLAEAVEALAAGGAKETSFDGRTVHATVDCAEESSLVVFTVPWAQGWTAKVDGEAADLVRADTAFMAVPVKGAGTHEVVLSFASPGRFIGGMISIVGVVALIVLTLVEGRREKKRAPRPRHARR